MLLWSFWAAKETAYKVIQKQYGNVSSAPRRYDVRLDQVPEVTASESQAVSGVVETPYSPVFIRITVRDDFIHCIGVSGEAAFLDSVIAGTGPVTDTLSPHGDSQSVRQLARYHLSSVLNQDVRSINITRTKDMRGTTPPVVFIGDERSTIDLSLSHDGNIAAYAFFQREDCCSAKPQNVYHAGEC